MQRACACSATLPRRSALATAHRCSSRGLGAGCTMGPTFGSLSSPPRSAPAGSKGTEPPSTKPLKMATAPDRTSPVPAPTVQAQESERRPGRGRALPASHARAPARLSSPLSEPLPRGAARTACRDTRPAHPVLPFRAAFREIRVSFLPHPPSRWWRSSLGDSVSATAGSFVSASPSCALPPARSLAHSRTRPPPRLLASCLPGADGGASFRFSSALLASLAPRRGQTAAAAERRRQRRQRRLRRCPRRRFPEEKRGSRMSPGGGASERERGGGGRRRRTRATGTSEAAAAQARGRGQVSAAAAAACPCPARFPPAGALVRLRAGREGGRAESAPGPSPASGSEGRGRVVWRGRCQE